MMRQMLCVGMLSASLNGSVASDFAELNTRVVPTEDLQMLNYNRFLAQEEEQVNLQKKDLEPGVKGSLLNKQASVYVVDYTYKPTQHIAAFFSPDGRIVELEDESQWLVLVNQVPKAAKWLSNDPIAVYPNKDLFFKATQYKLTNLTLNETVDVDLIRGPKLNSLYTKFVSAVDLYNDAIYLNDGTRWDIFWADSSIIHHWAPSDVVILGDNYGWFSNFYPHILINVSLNQYVCARRGY